MEITFKKVHTTKDLTISALFLAAGIALYFIQAGLGIFLAFCGILMLLFYKAGYKKTGENLILRKQAIDVTHACSQSLKDFLDGKDVEPEVVSGNAGGISRLEIYYNADAAVAYAQLFNYSQYLYEPATEIVELRGFRASKLIGKL